MPDILKTALAYKQRGWQPLPLPPKSKAPRISGWQNLIIDEAELKQHFTDKRQNIGVLLGEKSGGLTDVDLDSSEAIMIADYFLPETKAVFGRAGKQRSHRLYYSDYKKTERFSLDSCIVEVRADGGQTVFPPSTHVKGEQIEWHSEGEPLRIDDNQLRRAVTLLASACAISPFWREGLRHDLSLALSGVLLRNGFTEAETKNFISAICAATGDNELADRLLAVESNVSALRNKQNVYGLPKLKELTDNKVAKKLCEWLELKNTTEINNPEVEMDSDESETQPKRLSVANRLVGLTETFTFFHTSNRDTYSTVPIGSHFENMRLTSNDFKLHLSRLLWEDSKQTANAQSLQDAIAVLQGKALFESPLEEVYIRCADKDGAIFIDLGDEEWRVVKITETGWQIIESKDVPVKFRRTRGVLPLPIPNQTHNGLGELKDFVNVTDDDFILLCVWAVSAMRPGYSFPILSVYGGQGSAKSTLTRVLRDLLDPNSSALRSKPHGERDLMIAARNSWVLSFDNLSNISHDFSDSLCRLSTGGGLATRKLHSDDDEVIFDAKRPLVINGITDLATRSDLLERCLMLNLPTIDAARRQDEATFWKKFEDAKPRIFGALLDKLSESLRELPNVKLAEKPRMADFATFAYAGFGQEFLDRYNTNRDDANEIALQNSPVGETLLRFLNKLEHSQWSGTAKQLLNELVNVGELSTIQDRDFPKKPNLLSADLKRIEPNLESLGWKVIRSRSSDKNRARNITFIRTENLLFESSASSASSANLRDMDDKPITDNGKASNGDSHRPLINAANTKVKVNDGDADDSDGNTADISHLATDSTEREIFEV